MAFIRKVKTGSGATAVQVVYKRYGEVVKILHVGSAHSEQGVRVLEREARMKINKEQGALFDAKEFEERGEMASEIDRSAATSNLSSHEFKKPHTQ